MESKRFSTKWAAFVGHLQWIFRLTTSFGRPQPPYTRKLQPPGCGHFTCVVGFRNMVIIAIGFRVRARRVRRERSDHRAPQVFLARSPIPWLRGMSCHVALCRRGLDPHVHSLARLEGCLIDIRVRKAALASKWASNSIRRQYYNVSHAFSGSDFRS